MKHIDRKSSVLMMSWIVGLAILYSMLSVVRHNNFQSGAFDLGIYDQAVWQYSQFHTPYNTIKERFILGDHLTLTLPLLAPLYWMWNDVRFLLIFQAVFVSISTYGIFLYTKQRGFRPSAALAVSVLYSLFYGMQYGVYFDFHPVMIGVGLIPWFLYWFEKGSRRLWISTLVGLLATQENMGIAIASIGVIYLFEKRFRKSGMKFLLGGIVISFLSVGIISWISPIGYEYRPSVPFNPIEILYRFFDSPEKRQVWLYSLSWYSFLPLFSPGAIFAMVLDLSQYFLPDKQYGHMVTSFLHHRAILSPLLLMGVLQVLGKLKQLRQGKYVAPVVLCMVLSSVFQQYYFHLPLNKLSKAEFRNPKQWMVDTRVLLEKVPQKAAVVSTQHIVPHLTHRDEIYLLWPRLIGFEEGSPCGDDVCWWLEFAGEPEYLVINLDQDQWVTQLLEQPEHVIQAVENMKKRNILLEEANIGSAYMYQIQSKKNQ